MAVPLGNYYRKIADADAFFANQLYATDWTGAAEEDKAKALQEATRAFDRLIYKGVKSSLYAVLFAADSSSTDGDVLIATTKLTQSVIDAADELQQLQFPRDEIKKSEAFSITVDATGGTFDITFNGETAAAIAFDATPSAVQTALEGLTGVTVGDVLVTGSAGAYTVTTAGALALTNGNTITTDPTLLTGPGQTATVLTIVDNIPDPVFWAVCLEAKNLLAGIDPNQCFDNLVLTSDGIGSNRVSSDRSQMPPLHISHYITSGQAWQFVQPYLSDKAHSFDHIRS